MFAKYCENEKMGTQFAVTTGDRERNEGARGGGRRERHDGGAEFPDEHAEEVLEAEANQTGVRARGAL